MTPAPTATDVRSQPRLTMGYSGNRLVRGGENRGHESLAAALAHPDAVVYLNRAGQWLCGGSEDSPDPAFTVEAARALGADLDEATLLGWTVETSAPRLAARLPEGELAQGSAEFVDLRALGMRRRLGSDVEGQLAQGQHFLNWHGRARYCGRCGGETLVEAAGYRRRCKACGEMHFPRTDPVTIMLIHDGRGRCILGRQPHFVPGMWSCLAGFVEPGETLEDAVRRETLEEAGICVGAVAYHSSQPWPFPGSLMIGCLGVALNEEIVLQDEELEACRWFDVEEVRRMLAREHPEGLTAPHPFAIAHHLVTAFVEAAG